METVLFSVLIVIGVVLLFVVALLVFRAMMYGRLPPTEEPVEELAIKPEVVAEHLSSAVRVETISTGDPGRSASSHFERLHRVFEKQYPRTHATFTREIINQHSLLYTWIGRSPELDPILLNGHLDVVPADPATISDWTHPPFSGAIADGYVWGRGTLDMKGSVVTIFEAIEGLIKAGFQPERTIFLAFGHDEEIGGKEGAACIAEILTSRGVRLEALCDEGGSVTLGIVPGVNVPVALVGIAEKGYAVLELKVEGRPGHSSLPPRHTAIGILGRALAAVEANPMRARLSMAKLMFDELGIFLPFGTRLALANTWLFKGAVSRRLEASPNTNAVIRTTAAPTMIQGGIKENVLPAVATAQVNLRLLPGDTREAVLAHYRKAINDEAVQTRLISEHSWEAPPVTQMDSLVYKSFVRTIRQVFPEAAVAPLLMSGATDSRHYTGLTRNIFRFSPAVVDKELMGSVHGNNERVPVEGLGRMVQFYRLLIQAWAEA